MKTIVSVRPSPTERQRDTLHAALTAQWAHVIGIRDTSRQTIDGRRWMVL